MTFKTAFVRNRSIIYQTLPTPNIGGVIGIHPGLFATLAIVRLIAVSRRWALKRTDFEQWMKTTGAIASSQAEHLLDVSGTWAWLEEVR